MRGARHSRPFIAGGVRRYYGWKVFVLAIIVCGAAAGCNGDSFSTSASLTIEIANGGGVKTYTLKCEPPGGSAPKPTNLCATLAENGGTMVPPPSHGTCAGGFQTNHIHVRGMFDGKHVDTFADACTGHVEAESLWLRYLRPPRLSVS